MRAAVAEFGRSATHEELEEPELDRKSQEKNRRMSRSWKNRQKRHIFRTDIRAGSKMDGSAINIKHWVVIFTASVNR